jgi:hypothetical protein
VVLPGIAPAQNPKLLRKSSIKSLFRRYYPGTE